VKTARPKSQKNNKRTQIRTGEISIRRDSRKIGRAKIELEVWAEDEGAFTSNMLRIALENYHNLVEDAEFSKCLWAKEKVGVSLALCCLYYQRRAAKNCNKPRPNPLFEEANEEVYLNAIRDFGPVALRNPRLNNVLVTWLKNKRTAGNYINKIAMALKGNADVAHLPHKPGKPEVSFVAALGKAPIMIFYKDLTKVLALLKKDSEKFTGVEAIESLLEYWERYYQLTQNKGNVENSANLESRQKVFITGPSYLMPADLIYEKLKADTFLKAKFTSFDWVPNEFAQTLLGRILGVSSSKIFSILFR